MKKVREYYSDNLLKEEGYLHNCLREGLWIFYYQNGKTKREVYYQAGVEHGAWLMWHENGNIYIDQHKINGVTTGVWKEYYEDGKLKEIGEYIDGKYFPKDFWNEEGIQILKNGNGKKIEKFGAGLIDVFEHYFENGKLIKEIRI